MSRTETLELLAKLIDTLKGLGEAEPGRPLRSADWNTLVNGVVTMARLVESRERTTYDQLEGEFAPREHAHTGKADLSWFDPETRAMLEGRRLGPEVSNALAEMKRELGGMRKQVDQLQQEVDSIRLELYGLRDRDDARDKAVSRLDLRFESVADLEERVSSVDKRFDGVSRSVEEALAFRDTLEGVNLRELQERVSSVEALRENLETASGEVVQIRDFEQRLTQLESDTVKSRELDSELTRRLQDGGFLDETELASSLAELMDKRFDPRFAELLEVDQGLDKRIAGLDEDLAKQTAALGGVRTRVDRIEPIVDSTSGLTGRMDEITVRIDSLDATVATHETSLRDIGALPRRVAELESGLKNVSKLPGDVKDLAGRVSGLEKTVAPVPELQAAVLDHGKRLVTVEKLKPRLDQLDGRVGELERGKLGRLEERVTATEAQLDDLATFTGRMDDIVKEQEALSAWRNLAGARLDSLEGAVRKQESLAGSVNDIGRRTTALETQVKQLDRASATHAETLSALAPIAGRVSKIEGVTESLSRRVTQAQSQVGALETRMTSAESQVGALANAGFVDGETFKRLTGRLSNVENRMGTVEKRLGPLRPVPLKPTPLTPTPIILGDPEDR